MLKLSLNFILFLLIGQVIFSQTTNEKKIRVVNFDQFEPNLHFQNDTVYLVNFWATWCAPCRKEIPAIQKVGEKYSKNKFRILFVSLDMANELESRLKPFVNSNNIKPEVFLLTIQIQIAGLIKLIKAGKAKYHLL
jgi:thiol-disulfide isomerase/thioredoxin